MRLADLLSPRRVVVPLPADTWGGGIRALLDACLADGRVRDPARLEAAVRDAWPEDTLSLGPRAVLPHFRTNAVDSVVAVVVLVDSAAGLHANNSKQPAAARMGASEVRERDIDSSSAFCVDPIGVIRAAHSLPDEAGFCVSSSASRAEAAV